MKKVNLKKVFACFTVGAVVASMTAVGYCVGTAPVGMDTAMTTVKDDAMAALAVVAPIGITILGAFLVWKYGIKFFKGLAK